MTQTHEAPSNNAYITPADLFEPLEPATSSDRDSLQVPKRQAEPTQTYLKGNWEITGTLDNGMTTVVNNSGDIPQYLNLTTEELEAYVAVDQEAAAARAAARAEKSATEEQDPYTDDERREDLANLYAYLNETDPTPEVPTATKTSIGRNILRYFTERDPETGEFSYGSGSLTRKRSARAEQAAPSPEAIIEPVNAIESEQTTPENVEQAVDRPSLRERISARVQKGSEAAMRKLFRRSPTDEKQLGKTEKAIAKSDKKAKKLEGKLEKATIRKSEAEAKAEALREDIAAKELAKQEALKAQFASDYDEAHEYHAEREVKIEVAREEIREAAKLRSQQIIEDAILASEAAIAEGEHEAANVKLQEEVAKKRRRFARIAKHKADQAKAA